MSKIILCLCLLAFFSSANLKAQTVLIRQLLDLPAPAPKDRRDENKRPAGFYDDKNAPADDAPIEDLLDYWVKKGYVCYSPNQKCLRASVKSSRRMIEAVENDPGKFYGFLNVLSVDKEIAERVKQFYDLKQTSEDVSDSWREKVKNWLKFNSDFYVDELFTEAEQARDHKQYSSVIKSSELQALAEKDWARAAPLLKELEADKTNPRTAVFAKTLFYERAIRDKETSLIDKYRDELKAVVENKSASGSERDLAFEALTDNAEWQGFDDWYLSLFADETLLELNLSGSTVTSPLNSVAEKKPEKWIPILAKLVGNKNRAIHNAAVEALVQFQNQDAKKDALEPLLPWLTDEKWATDTGSQRLRLIQSMSNVDLPESIPGLIWVVQNDEDQSNRSYGAQSLGKYKDPRAIPALQFALGKETEEYHREFLISSLIACGGMTDAEQIAALETYTIEILKPDGIKNIDDRYEHEDENPLPVVISIGKYVAKQRSPAESFVRAVFGRIDELKKTNPDAAKKMLEIANKWQGKAVDAALIKRITDADVDVDAIITVIERRKELRESVPLELSWLTAKSGLAQAIGVGVFEDEAQMSSLATGETNAETQAAALAVARLTRLKLPVQTVGTLLDSNDKLLALAAERYLESEDSAEAQELVLARHTGEFLILGARDCFYPKKVANAAQNKELFLKFGCSIGYYYGYQFDEFDKQEEDLSREMRENKDLLEIYAHGTTILRVFRDRAVLTWENDAATFYEKTLTKAELDGFHNAVIDNKLDEKPPEFGNPGFATGIGQFTMLNRRGGRRLFAYGGMSAGLWMSAIFWNLQTSDVKPRFKFAKDVKGLEILIAEKRFIPKAIWKNGDDFRVLVEDKQRKSEISDELDKLKKIDDANEDLDYKTRGRKASQRRNEREFEQYEWRKIESGKLDEATVDEPAEIPFLREHRSFPAMEDLESNENLQIARSGNYEIRVGDDTDSYGLWKVNRAERVKIADGWMKNPVTTADGKWIIASKTDTNWSEPNYLVRVNLQTGKVSKIKTTAAKNLSAIARVPAHNKILLRSFDDLYNDVNVKYYLLDAETGAVAPVTGVFAPLRQQTFRGLQPTGKPNEFWAAVYDKKATEIGIYNDKTFSFKPRVRLPEIALDSMDIWVDERAEKIYFIYSAFYGEEGYLLSIPLPPDK